MRQFTVAVEQVARQAGGVVVSLAGPTPLFAPGQAALAHSTLPSQPLLRVPLYPFHSTAAGFEFMLPGAPHPYAALHPGDELDVLGPCGHGFELPLRAGRLLAAAASPARLLALLEAALARGWAVVAAVPPEVSPLSLPQAVEVVRLPGAGGELSDEMLGWADVVALDVPEPAQRAAEIRARQRGRGAGYIQALVDAPMPCGTGACQACWVPMGPGRRPKRACVDGPVIQW